MPTLAEVIYAVTFGEANTKELDAAERKALESKKRVGVAEEQLRRKIRSEIEKEATTRKRIEAEVEAEIDAAHKRQLERWKKNGERARSVLKGIAVGATAAAAGIIGIAERTSEASFELDKWAKTLGATTAEIQTIVATAEQFGAPADNTIEAVKTLRENLGEMERVGTGPAVESLETLGLTLSSIIDLPVEDQMAKLSEAFRRLPNQSERISVALELMGEDGRALLPVFAQGATAIREYGQEARDAGLIMSNETVAGGVAMRRELLAGKQQLAALVQVFGQAAIPIVREWLKSAMDWIKANRDLLQQNVKAWLERIASAIETVVTAGAKLIEMVGGAENAFMIAGVAVVGFQTAMLGIPGIAATVGFAIGALLFDLQGTTAELQQIRAEIQKLEGDQRRFKAGTNAIGVFSDLSKGGTALTANEVDFERFVTEARAGLSSSGPAERRAIESRIADARYMRSLDRDLAARKAFKASRKDAASADAKAVAKGRKAAGRGRKEDEILIDTNDDVVEQEFGDELRRLASRDGAGDVAVDEALTAAAQSLSRGDTLSVARKSAFGRLGASTGRDYTTPSSDPLLSQIFGEDVPDVELSSIARGAQPSVLISNITNNFNFDVDQEINGAGDPAGNARALVSEMRDQFQASIRKATRTVKVEFIR